MRGNVLHNSIARDAGDICTQLAIRSRLEHSIKVNGRYLYLDVAAWVCGQMVAIEIETSIRRISNTVAKAMELGIELWIVVPRRKLRHQVANKLKKLDYDDFGITIKLLLLDELWQALRQKLSLNIAANCWPDRQ
jgi:hypothetical protein